MRLETFVNKVQHQVASVSVPTSTTVREKLFYFNVFNIFQSEVVFSPISIVMTVGENRREYDFRPKNIDNNM